MVGHPDERSRSDGPEALVLAAREAGVRDERVLRALREVPREGFVPIEEADHAYLDRPIPIPHGQVTTQPSLTARMVAALGLRGGESVLEVGTGHGFQTALLASLADRVFSIERFADLAATARRNLAREGVGNVEVVVGDGTAGLPSAAPFDAIVVSAAFTRVPEPLASQLTDGGRLVQPVGPGGRDEVMLFVRQKGELTPIEHVVPAHFVRLCGEHGFPDSTRARA